MPIGSNSNLEQEFDYGQLYDSKNLDAAILAGQVVVNDGVSDLSPSKGSDFLRSAHKKYVDDQIFMVNTDSTTFANNIQAELDLTQLSAGLNIDGSFTANILTNYLADSTSLVDSDEILDNKVHLLETQIGTLTGTTVADLQLEVDNIETASGLNTDGTFNSHIGTNYLDSATNAKVAREILDTQLKTTNDALATETTNRINADNLKFDKTGGTITGDINILDNEIFSTSIPTSPNSLVNKEYTDSIASGFRPKAAVIAATKVALPANTYNNGTAGVGATITADAIGVLPQIDTVDLVIGDFVLIKNETDPIKNGIYVVSDIGSVSTPFILTRRSDMDGSPVGEMATGSRVYVSGGDSNRGAAFTLLGELNTNLTCGTNAMNWGQTGGEAAVSNVQGEVDAMELALGLNTNGTFSQHVGTHFIDTAETAKEARELLDTQVNINKLGISEVTGDIADIFTTLSNMTVINGKMYAKDAVRDK